MQIFFVCVMQVHGPTQVKMLCEGTVLHIGLLPISFILSF